MISEITLIQEVYNYTTAYAVYCMKPFLFLDSFTVLNIVHFDNDIIRCTFPESVPSWKYRFRGGSIVTVFKMSTRTSDSKFSA